MIVKTGAFMPHKGSVSVFRTINLTEDEIWDIGINKIEATRSDGRSLKARGDTFVH